MDYYSIWDKDQRHNNYILREAEKEIPKEIRAVYRRDTCDRCTRMDAKHLIRLGIPDDVEFKVRAGTEFFFTTDKWPVINGRGKRILEEIDPELVFVAVPNQDFFVIVTKLLVSFDFEKAGLNDLGSCAACGRGRYNGPLTVESLHRKKGVESRVFTVKPLVATYALNCSKEVMRRLKNETIRGMLFDKIRHMADLDKFREQVD